MLAALKSIESDIICKYETNTMCIVIEVAKEVAHHRHIIIYIYFFIFYIIIQVLLQLATSEVVNVVPM